MLTINISLPDELKAFIETEMARVGYASASEYVCALIRATQMRRAHQSLEAELFELGAQARYELTPANLIWNRACDGGGSAPREGDRALAALLRAHGLTMNGGVLHAVECLTASELQDAVSGYRFFGLDPAAEFFSRARRILEAAENLESQDAILDQQYAALIPDDSFLVTRFERHMNVHPQDFAPL